MEWQFKFNEADKSECENLRLDIPVVQDCLQSAFQEMFPYTEHQVEDYLHTLRTTGQMEYQVLPKTNSRENFENKM